MYSSPMFKTAVQTWSSTTLRKIICLHWYFLVDSPFSVSGMAFQYIRVRRFWVLCACYLVPRWDVDCLDHGGVGGGSSLLWVDFCFLLWLFWFMPGSWPPVILSSRVSHVLTYIELRCRRVTKNKHIKCDMQDIFHVYKFCEYLCI